MSPVASFADPPGADVVVVGSGMSGIALANGLVDAGIRNVVVLEAGPSDRASAWRLPADAAPRWAAQNLPHYPPPGPASPESALPGLGGRSLYWHGVLLPVEAYALADPRWPADVRESLTGRDGHDGLYPRTLDDIAVWAASDGCRPVSDDPADGVFVEWLGAAMFKEASRVPQAVRRHADGRSEVFTPLQRFSRLCAGEMQGAPRVRTGMRVDGIAVRAGRVLGVQTTGPDGGTALLEAPVVVLAAGTLENTRLVGQLDPRGVSYEGLNDHLTQGFLVRVPAARFPRQLRDGAFAILERSATHRCNVFARLRPLEGTRSLLLDVWALGEQLPSAANRIHVAPCAPGNATHAQVDVHAGLTPADHDVLEGSRERLSEAWQQLARQLRLPSRPLYFDNFFAASRPFHAAREAALRQDNDSPLTYSWPLGAGDHESGTLPLGGVLDADGALHGVDGLYVAGPAVFPRSGAANPSLTTLTLAQRTAAAIARR